MKNRYYGIREDGFIELIYRQGDSLGQNLKGGAKQPHEEDESDSDDNTPSIYEGSLTDNQLERREVQIVDVQDETQDTSEAQNSSIVAGSDPEDNEDQPEDEDQQRSTSANKQSLFKTAEKPSTHLVDTDSNCFFRTLAANENFVVAVAHDGKGNNTLYVYNPGLKLLATKKVTIKKKDFSFNMSTGHLPQTPTCTRWSCTCAARSCSSSRCARSTSTSSSCSSISRARSTR